MTMKSKKKNEVNIAYLFSSHVLINPFNKLKKLKFLKFSKTWNGSQCVSENRDHMFFFPIYEINVKTSLFTLKLFKMSYHNVYSLLFM